MRAIDFLRELVIQFDKRRHWTSNHPDAINWFNVLRLGLFQLGLGLSLAPLTGYVVVYAGALLMLVVALVSACPYDQCHRRNPLERPARYSRRPAYLVEWDERRRMKDEWNAFALRLLLLEASEGSILFVAALLSRLKGLAHYVMIGARSGRKERGHERPR